MKKMLASSLQAFYQFKTYVKWCKIVIYDHFSIYRQMHNTLTVTDTDNINILRLQYLSYTTSVSINIACTKTYTVKYCTQLEKDLISYPIDTKVHHCLVFFLSFYRLQMLDKGLIEILITSINVLISYL